MSLITMPNDRFVLFPIPYREEYMSCHRQLNDCMLGVLEAHLKRANVLDYKPNMYHNYWVKISNASWYR